jgi:hypothetical protein
MKTQFANLRSFSVLVVIVMILSFALSVAAQKKGINPILPLAEDTSIYPHDFADDFYAENGVLVKGILGRRTGNDFMSVIGMSTNPIHNNIRILATFPAYDQNGNIFYWSPLGMLNDNAFDDAAGIDARLIANSNPIYVFPRAMDWQTDTSPFINARQASLIDDSTAYLNSKGNPLGLRLIVVVNYTEKAFNTMEGLQMMAFMSKKNGRSYDDTPLIKSMEDLQLLSKYEMVSMDAKNFAPEFPLGTYVISPVIENVVKGVIAPDAFLFTVTKDGEPLPGERVFVEQFNCLQKFGNWCNEN